MKQLLSIVLTAAFLCGCGNERIEELEYELEEAQKKLENIESEFEDIQLKMRYLDSAIDELKNEIDDFSYENWRDNVPEAESAAEDVESAFHDLKREVDDIEYEF